MGASENLLWVGAVDVGLSGNQEMARELFENGGRGVEIATRLSGIKGFQVGGKAQGWTTFLPSATEFVWCFVDVM